MGVIDIDILNLKSKHIEFRVLRLPLATRLYGNDSRDFNE
jgi:hypothetical protein